MAINLNKITLEKSGDSHRFDLTKNGSGDLGSAKEMVINLNWNQKSGFWAKLTNSAIDLDLGCFYELADGRKSAIDGLQFAHNKGGSRNQSTRQGCYTQVPWIWHSGDDRDGGASDGENILVNPAGWTDIKRIIVYCFIYEGVAKWEETDAVVTIKVPDNPDVVVEMGKHNDSRKFCAIAEIQLSANSMTVKKLVTFHDGHSDCDKKYGIGMSYSPGTK